MNTKNSITQYRYDCLFNNVDLFPKILLRWIDKLIPLLLTGHCPLTAYIT